MSDKRTRGFRILIVVCCFLLVFMTGCKAEEKPVEIVFMHGWGGTLKNHNTMQMIYNQFQEENPDILLTCITAADSRITVKNANDMLAVNKTPDIISTNGLAYYVDNAVKQNKALDLAPYFQADLAFHEQIHPLVKQTWTNKDGSIYTVPDALEVMGYWYNASYLKSAGCTDDSGELKLPATWPEFMDMCEKLALWCEKQENIDPFALEEAQLAENLFFARLAGDSEEGLKMTANLPTSFDTQAMNNTVADIGSLMKFSRNVDTIDNARQLFVDGKTALYFNGIWENEMLNASPYAKDIGCACYPAWNGESLSYVSPSSGYVLLDNGNEKKKEACIRFLKYILSEPVQEKIALKTGQAPENPNLNLGKLAKESPLFGESLKNLNNSKIQIMTLGSVWGGQIEDSVKRNLIRVARGDIEYRFFIKQIENLK